ncbi:MAG: hypothetical protein JNM58_15850 [Xanthomonadaceae bacterium]|nr:hypothetical protein [Xanthomonadaceae bacterium]
MIRLPLALALSLVVVPALAQSSTPAEAVKPANETAPAAPAAPALPPGMKQYWFVMLKKGPKRDQSPEEAKQLQAGHMANIQAYATMGKLQIAGPFMDDGDWRGIFILDVPDRAAAEAMCNDDPAVKAGRLACEIHPWMSMKGATLK